MWKYENCQNGTNEHHNQPALNCTGLCWMTLRSWIWCRRRNSKGRIRRHSRRSNRISHVICAMLACMMLALHLCVIGNVKHAMHIQLLRFMVA